MSDPVSWLLIERGWTVRSAGGEELGTIDEVVGSREDDIFDGLSVSSGFMRAPQYVPAESRGEIREGEVRLTIERGDLERAPVHEEPPAQERVLPEQSSWWLRALDRFRSRR